MTTDRDLMYEQPHSGWVMTAVAVERCQTEDEIVQLREHELAHGIEEWALPQDRHHIHQLLKMFWDILYIEPVESDLRPTPQGWRWHRETGGSAY